MFSDFSVAGHLRNGGGLIYVQRTRRRTIFPLPYVSGQGWVQKLASGKLNLRFKFRCIRRGSARWQPMSGDNLEYSAIFRMLGWEAVCLFYCL
jgi:hypothetical protein